MATRGILRYRGYPIELLAEKCTFLEVAYLILFGELPTEAELKDWADEITHHTMLHETTKKFMEGFRYDAHPMGDAGEHGGRFVHRLSRTPGTSTIRQPPAADQAADWQDALHRRHAYRHSLGFPYVYPDNDFSYSENFMNMLWKMIEPKYQANPVLARALDILFILHADHEQNCSANAMRSVGSAHADPFSPPRPRPLRFPDRCMAEPMKKC